MFRDLRTQLLLWTIFPLGAILVVVAYFGVNSHQTAMREMVAERDGVVARVAAEQWSDTLAMHARLLPTLDPSLPAQCDTSCAAFDGGIALFDAQGNLERAQPSTAVWQSRRAQIASLLDKLFGIVCRLAASPRAASTAPSYFHTCVGRPGKMLACVAVAVSLSSTSGTKSPWDCTGCVAPDRNGATPQPVNPVTANAPAPMPITCRNSLRVKRRITIVYAPKSRLMASNCSFVISPLA